ncbi:MAG: cell division protein FtsB [Halieaceae bacterium]|nr:cell division protein FtsB [Halieaceae bacterium]
MKWLSLGLFLLLVLAQYRLWFAEQGSLAELHRLEADIERQQALNAELAERNARLEQEVLELQQGMDTVEERARRDLGMIREGEIYYQVVEPGEQTPTMRDNQGAGSE